MNRKIESVALAGLIAFTAACDQPRPVTQPSPVSASAEPTLAPETPPAAAINSPEAPTTEPEKPPAEGWDPFVSLNFPYQIDYPQEWTTKKSWDGWDLFLSDKRSREYSSLHISGVRIKAENVPDWITLEAYTQQRLDDIKKRTDQINRGQGTIDGVAARSLVYTYSWGSVPTEIRTFNEILQGGYRSIVVGDAFVIKDGKIWKIQFVADASDPNVETEYQKYIALIKTFKFLR